MSIETSFGLETGQPYPYQTGQQTGEPHYAPGQQPPPSGPRQYGVPPTSGDEALWGPAGPPWQQPPPAPAPPPPVEGEGEGPGGGLRR